MQFVQGAGVYTADDQQVGHVDRVVIDPKTLEVTHIVVQKGFLFTEDKVVPLDLIAEANEDRVALREHAGKLLDLGSQRGATLEICEAAAAAYARGAPMDQALEVMASIFHEKGMSSLMHLVRQFLRLIVDEQVLLQKTSPEIQNFLHRLLGQTQKPIVS